MFVGLVRDPKWEPPDGFPSEPGRRRPELPWRRLAWIAAFWVALLLVPAVLDAFGTLVGLGLLMATLTVGAWRLDRWCSRQYWRGMRDYRS